MIDDLVVLGYGQYPETNHMSVCVFGYFYYPIKWYSVKHKIETLQLPN